MIPINNRYYNIASATGEFVTLQNQTEINVNSTGYPASTTNGSMQRVYTLTSPFAAADLSLVKFAQNANTMVLTHPNYPPQLLTLVSATNWTITPITFGTTVTTPTGTGGATTLAAGNVNYAYCVTAVDANAQESAQSARVALASLQDLRSVG